ncbi:hypothetical protein LptCag_2306 [Leptospirillum ferriphilum]|jgi:hypothetical protein|uniref:Uncharacterized protein n=1 Tax=Leptospirillum ferriphilum TaxID=178606 RepID=A0A094WGT8_9BACT|nr:hypothetical protein LptCag_2306 [Leptospirillum ferriphilum]
MLFGLIRLSVNGIDTLRVAETLPEVFPKNPDNGESYKDIE